MSKSFSKNTQLRVVSHILVDHEYQAQDLLRLLASGKPFTELAEKFSKCPSGKKGGELGPLQAGKFVDEFEEAADLLKAGEISAPVRTRFGYHLICWQLGDSEN